METDNEGFRVAVNQGLTKPFLVAGVPKMVAMVLGIIALNSILILKTLWILPVLAVAWMACSHAVKQDPEFFSVLLKHMKDKDFLEP